jgi:hypothetical protein
MSFSGQDADVYMYLPSSDPDGQSGLIYVDSIQTISVSTFRDKSPVRALGYANVKGHTRGVRTIAGSMIFAVLNTHPLRKLINRLVPYDYEWSFDRYSHVAPAGSNNMFPDMIPPFNVMIVYKNELGSAAMLQLIGIDLTNDGLVTSIEDLLTEKTVQYRARDLRVFQGVQGANGLWPGQDDVSRIISGTLLDGTLSEGAALPYDDTYAPEVPASNGQSLTDRLKSAWRGS